MNGEERYPPNGDDLRAIVGDLCRRLERVEARLGMEAPVVRPEQPEPVQERSISEVRAEQESLEFAVGQAWFALLGIVVLAIGMAFLLSLPFSGLPPYLPSMSGYLVCALLFYLAGKTSRSFADISKYLRGAAMLLLFFATWRLFDFGAEAALAAGSLPGMLLILVVTVLNLFVAWRRASPVLFSLALLTGMAGALVIRDDWFALVMITLMVVCAAWAQVKLGWRSLASVVFALAMAAYIIWAIGIPSRGEAVGVDTTFPYMPWGIPVWILLLSLAVMKREDRSVEDTAVQVTGIILCLFGYGIFMLHQLLGYDHAFLLAQLVMAALLIGISVAFLIRERSRFSTFVYAMTGYMALSMALIKAFDSPEVFVALSLQSLVVIATAILFCSPFIVVANSLIFIGIIIGYLVVADVEQGMSIGFGVVALISARVLNWQKERLTLRTELMRNTYLLTAFFSFPYALYYLVPATYTAVAWTGLGLFYYGLHLYFGNRKYRWMGHATLVLTALYVLVVGTASLQSHYRIITFLILGSILVVVSIVFTILRARRQKDRSGEETS